MSSCVKIIISNRTRGIEVAMIYKQVHHQFACSLFGENPQTSATNKRNSSPPDMKSRNNPDIITALHDSLPAFL